MNGALYLFALVLLLYITSMLVMRFAAGSFQPLKQPITWFYVSWMVGLILLVLPLYEYEEKVTGDVLAYMGGALIAFSVGCIAAVFFKAQLQGEALSAVEVEADAKRVVTLTRWLLILGLIGTLLLILNTHLSGTLSFSDRLNSENAGKIREEHMSGAVSAIGPLFGPASITSSAGGLGVALVMYFLGRGIRPGARDLKPLAIAVLTLNCLGAFVAFGSRMFAVFFLLVAFFAFAFGRWASGRKTIAYRFNARRVLVVGSVSIATTLFLWFSTTYFLEKRVGGQSPSVLLFKTHRAKFSPPLYDVIRGDLASQYVAFSLSYFSTPIPTLTFYLDLPDDRMPGPFWGQYNFPAVARWVRRLAFIPNPIFWEEARLEIFAPLGAINFGTNVWATLLRDLMADFGKSGSIAFLAILGFVSQSVASAQARAPTAVKAALMAYMLIVLLFSGFISTLFMPQIHWPLYIGGLLLFTRFNKKPIPKLQRPRFERKTIVGET